MCIIVVVNGGNRSTPRREPAMADKYVAFSNYCKEHYTFEFMTLYNVIISVAINDAESMAHMRCAMGAKFGSMALAPWDSDEAMERSNTLYVDEMREVVDRVRILTGLDREAVRLAMMAHVQEVLMHMQDTVACIKA